MYDDICFIFHTGIYLTFKVTSDVPVTHVAANTDSTVPSPAVVTISCNQCFSVNKWFTSGKWKGSGKLIIPYCLASQKLNFSLSSFNIMRRPSEFRVFADESALLDESSRFDLNEV